MSENVLAVKITADVASLQAQFATAQASTNALKKEMADLAKQSAAGLLDPAGLAQLEEASRRFLEAKEHASELKTELKGTREEFDGFGGALEDIRGKLSTAFEVTGLAAGIEMLRSFGEMLEKVGENAQKLRASATVLDLTTDQLQALQHAGEAAGVGSDQLLAAGERLIGMLTKAREGSAQAADKLLKLGVSADQINDPTYTLNDLLKLLHDRLENASTAQQTLNDLVATLGPRAGLVAAAMKEYDGTAEGVARVMAKLNGLTTDQIERVGKAKETWGDYFASVGNGLEKLIMGSQALDMKGMNALTMSNIGSVSQVEAATNPFKDLAEQAGEAATEAAKEMTAAGNAAAAQAHVIENKKLQEELANIKLTVAAARAGSAEKVSALKEELAVAQKLYGSDQIDKVQTINAELLSAEASYHEKSDQMWLQDYNQRWKLVMDEGKIHIHNIEQMLNADGQYLTSRQSEAKTLEELENYGKDLSLRATKEKAQGVAELTRINAKATQDQLAQWQFLTNGMKSGFDSALKGILSGTENVGQAMRNIFTSVLDGIISKLAEWAAEWVTKLIIVHEANQVNAASSVAANASVAAVAAMASVAAIPFYGWAMAPEVGAATYAEGMAYEASAAGGYDVPRGMSPVTRLHPEEMVLPKPIADTVRNAVSGGSGANGTGGGGKSVSIYGNKSSTYTHDQLLSMLTELGHQFKLR